MNRMEMDQDLDEMVMRRRRDRRSRDGGGGGYRERRGENSRRVDSGYRNGSRNYTERGRWHHDLYQDDSHRRRNRDRGGSYDRYYQQSMMPRNSSRMVNYVSIPVPMSVPFPAAVGGGGYRGRRRESRGGERSRDIYPRVDQRDSYRRRSNERVSSRRGSRKPFLDRITVNHERYSSRGGDDRRQRRSKGGNVKSSSHKKMSVNQMDMELDTYMRGTRHPRIV